MTGTTYQQLVQRYPAYGELIDRFERAVDTGESIKQLMPKAYKWIDKHIERADQPVARQKLEVYGRLLAERYARMEQLTM